MKSFLLVFFYLALVTGSSLSDRSGFARRNNGVPLNARRFILRSEPQAPPACASGVQLPTSSVSAIPTAVTPTATVSGISDTNINTTDSSSDPIQTLSANVTDNEVPSADASATESLNSTDTSIPTLTSTTSDAVNTSLSRRFAQFDLPDLALTWQDLCLSSGGDIFTNQPCVDLAGLGGISALLANSDPCDQQNIADAMIDFAKSDGVVNSEDLIAFALQYRRHPRNALNILGFVPSTPYCLIAPKNPELVGVWNDQLDGVVPGLFGGPDFPVVAFGADGTCPFGLTPDVSTCSCVSSGTDDSNGIDTGITSDGLNGTDISSNSTISADGTNSTDTGSLDTSDSSNSTDTSGSVDSGVISDGNSTDVSASASVDAGTDSASSTTSSSDAASTTAVESDGSVTDSATSASTSADTAVDTATATDATAQNTTPSSTDTELAFNTGRPDVNDPQGR